MAIKTINMRAAQHGIYDHNNVVPGVLSCVLFRAGNIHGAQAGELADPDSVTDLKGVWTPSVDGNGNVDVEGSGSFSMPVNNYNYGDPAADNRFPQGHIVLQTEREKSKMTYSLTQEKGLAMYDINIELYVPHISSTIGGKLESFRGEPLHAAVRMYDKHKPTTPFETDLGGDSQDDNAADGVEPVEYLVGWDKHTGIIGTAYSGANDQSGYYYTDFCLFLDSIEFDSGAAMTDKNGATLKFKSFQGSAPIRLA